MSERTMGTTLEHGALARADRVLDVEGAEGSQRPLPTLDAPQGEIGASWESLLAEFRRVGEKVDSHSPVCPCADCVHFMEVGDALTQWRGETPPVGEK